MSSINQRSVGKPVTAYLKPSDYCNVGCDHCYLPAFTRAQKTRMDDDTFRSAIQTIKDMAAAQNAPGVLIIWHGGEPLALPKDYFEDLCLEVKEQIPSAIQTIQTSLIPYRSEWSPLIHRFFDGHIGTSIDFSLRTLRGSSKAYLDLFSKKVELARADGHTITPGMVPSKGEIGKADQVNDWMVSNGFRQWNIDRYNSFGKDDPNRPTNQEHSQFLTQAFDEVMRAFQEDGLMIKVNTVQAALGGIVFNAPGDRWGGSCSNDFLVINPDGRTNACPDKISYEGFSNIKDGYKSFKLSEERKKWIRDHLTGHRNSDCPTCPFNTFCKSGCPLTPNTPDSEGECSGYHRHLRHVREWVKNNRSAAIAYLEESRQ